MIDNINFYKIFSVNIEQINKNFQLYDLKYFKIFSF
jgi:hypothetical protein